MRDPRFPSGRAALAAVAVGCAAGCEGEGPVTAVDGPTEGLVAEAEEVRPCAEPQAQVAYEEVGEAMGLGGPASAEPEHLTGGAVAVDDLDGDGDLDLVLLFPDSPPTLYRREGDRFAAEPLADQAPAERVALADLDGDGLRDLVFAGEELGLLLLRGDGFEPAPLPPLPVNDPKIVRELTPGDLDGDGVLDLFGVVRGVPENPEAGNAFVLRGDGGGGFEVEEVGVPVEVGARQGFDGLWFDWEGDGDLDVYVSNDMGETYGGNVLYRNEDGTLSDASSACRCGVETGAMGTAVGDGNGDGLPDLYVAATFRNVLLEGQPDGTFVDVAQARSAEALKDAADMAWGAAWLDHDNDGLSDLLVAQGDLWGASDPLPAFESPIRLLRGDGQGYRDVGPELGLAQQGSHRAAVPLDFNGDGVLDLLVTDVDRGPWLYLSRGCTAAGWLEVEAPPGSRIEVVAGGRTQVAWASLESGWGAARPPIAHFGLGAAQQVERLHVVWNGRGVLLEDPLEARRIVRVRPDGS